MFLLKKWREVVFLFRPLEKMYWNERNRINNKGFFEKLTNAFIICVKHNEAAKQEELKSWADNQVHVEVADKGQHWVSTRWDYSDKKKPNKSSLLILSPCV